MVFAFVERVLCGFDVEKKVVVIEKFEDGGFFGGSGVSCGMFNLNFIRKNFVVDEVHGDVDVLAWSSFCCLMSVVVVVLLISVWMPRGKKVPGRSLLV